MAMVDLKRMAAEEAAKRVQNGQRLGLGTGSTAAMFLEALAERLRAGELTEIVGVATSRRTEEQARFLGIPLVTLEAEPALDLAVDGADEVDPQLNLIKGLGGALLREKVVAMASHGFIVIVDEGKMVARLGHKAPVPVEVLSFGWKPAMEEISALGARVELRREGGSPYVTDEDNYILDCHFERIFDLSRLAHEFDAIPAVMGHGLFLHMADEVIVGTESGPRIHKLPT